MADEKNVTKEGKTVRVERAFVVAAKADLAKKEIRLTLSIKLDESSLSVRDDFAYWQFDETPIKVTLKPVRQQMDLPMGDDTQITLSGGGQSVTMSSGQFKRAVNDLTGEIDEDEGNDE